MRLCTNCGAVEPGWPLLMLRPERAFAIRSDDHHHRHENFCTFECSWTWHEKQRNLRMAADGGES